MSGTIKRSFCLIEDLPNAGFSLCEAHFAIYKHYTLVEEIGHHNPWPVAEYWQGELTIVCPDCLKLFIKARVECLS